MSDKHLVPHSVEAEESVLGSILVNPDSFHAVNTIISTCDFYVQRYAWIYDAMSRLVARKITPDIATLPVELSQMEKLSEIGGISKLVDLVTSTPSSLNADGYARIIHEMAIRRRLIEAAQKVVRVSHSDKTSIDDVIRQSEVALMDAVTSQKRISRVTASEARRRMENKGEEKTLVTEIEELDRITDYQIKYGRSLHILAASEHYKTTLSCQLAADWAIRNIPVLYVSMENAPEDIYDKMAKYVAFSRKILYQDACKLLDKSALELLSGRQFVKDIETQVIAMSCGGQEKGVVFVDTAQKLMDCDRKGAIEQSGVSSASAALDGAKLNTGWLWVILIQQYIETNTTDALKLRPSRNNVKDAKALFQDADLMIGGYWADAWRHEFGADWDDPKCPSGSYMIRCIKNRFGNKRASKYELLSVAEQVPAVVSPKLLQKPVQKSFAAHAEKSENGQK
jgi:replicative DNA helicase